METEGDEMGKTWENTHEAGAAKGGAVVRVWDRSQVEQIRDAQKSCPMLGKLWIQMTGKLHHKEIKGLLLSNEFKQLCKVRRWLIIRDVVSHWRGQQTHRSKWLCQ